MNEHTPDVDWSRFASLVREGKTLRAVREQMPVLKALDDTVLVSKILELLDEGETESAT